MAIPDAPDSYSHKQDLEQLLNTLVSLKQFYDDGRKRNIFSKNEAEFRAYQLILEKAARLLPKNHENQLVKQQ